MEIWRSIDAYSNYEVSTYGRVKHATRGIILKPRLRTGYLAVGLCLNGVSKTYSIHTLVANEFIDNPRNKPLVDHIDNDKTNNHASNLRYANASQNRWNRLKQEKPTTSSFKGVTWHNRYLKWFTRIQIEGERKTLDTLTMKLKQLKHTIVPQKLNLKNTPICVFPEES